MSSIKVPPLGESIVEATVSRWLKKEGDVVQVGETLVELETDKITVEVTALEAGVLSQRTKPEGAIVSVGESIGEIGAGSQLRLEAAGRETGGERHGRVLERSPAEPMSGPLVRTAAAI